MRISLFFPRLKTFSGAEHLLLEFSRHAAAQGHEVVVLTRRIDSACRPHVDPRVEVRVIPLASFLTGQHLVDSLLDMLFSPLLLRHLPARSDVLCFLCPPVLPAMYINRRWLRRHIPTVYYCLQPPRFAYDLMRQTITANRPLGYLIPPVAAAYRWLDRRAVAQCDELFVLSSDYRRWCETLYQPDAIRIVYPGIDLEAGAAVPQQRLRERLGFEEHDKLVLTVNKLIPRKNVDVFLRAMRIVCEKIPEARGVVVGDGPEQETLRDLHKQLQLGDRVRFTGFLPEFRDVLLHYAASDVYVFLERNVPFGLTVLEAGMCGKPVIAVEGGGTRDTVVPGHTGILVSHGFDEQEVARCIVRLLESPDEARRLGSGAQEHARRFSWRATANAFLGALEDVVQRRAHDRGPPDSGPIRAQPS